jgi:hypothetical protein
VIERVVENWLSSANERQYQIPFCQLLSAEGETIIYISPHGQMEQGKDVVTVGPDGGVRAYQLKGGRLTLKDWRSYKGEIDELVVYEVQHPSLTKNKNHKSFLVTNGTVADPVLRAIHSANGAWAKVKAGPLTLIAGNELLTRFVKAHGRFLPRETKDFTKFLELIVNSGTAQFDKRRFASFLESILYGDLKVGVSARDVQRAICSTVLLTTYIIQGCQNASNHWGVFEAWTVMAAYIGSVASKHGIAPKWWSPSIELCILGGMRALDDLGSECATNTSKFTQGNPFTDGHFYNSRITLLSGLLGAASISHRLKREAWEHEDFVQRFLVEYLPKVRLWGESAVPYLVLAALTVERRGHHVTAEGLILQLVKAIAETNGTRGKGLPNPYYEAEEALRIQYGLDDLNPEVFSGHSYTIEPLIQFLARRLIRRQLAVLWEKITRLHFAKFQPEKEWEYLRWRSDGGSLITTFPKSPQSWKALVQDAERSPTSIPAIFERFPELAVHFALVFPHRFTSDLLKIIEAGISAV